MVAAPASMDTGAGPSQSKAAPREQADAGHQRMHRIDAYPIPNCAACCCFIAPYNSQITAIVLSDAICIIAKMSQRVHGDS